jgi:uncharacterized protein
LWGGAFSALQGTLMKRLLLAAALAASLCAPVRAQDAGSPEALRAAQELSALITGDTVHQMASGMISQMWPHIEAQFAGKVDAATIADLRTEFEHTLTTYTDEMMKDAPAIYARYFTAGELREMIAFYKSPTGIKALHTMPKVMADVTGIMVPRMQGFQNDMNARLVAVLVKHGYKN